MPTLISLKEEVSRNKQRIESLQKSNLKLEKEVTTLRETIANEVSIQENLVNEKIEFIETTNHNLQIINKLTNEIEMCSAHNISLIKAIEVIHNISENHR